VAWQAIAGFSFATLSGAMGIAFKAGHFPTARRRAGWYHDFYANDGLARWQRNYLSAAIPFGVAVGSMTAAALVAPSPDRANGAEIGLVLVAFAGFAIAVAFLSWNPQFMKPSWLRAVEEGRASVPEEPAPGPAWATKATWLMLAAGAVAAWRFGELGAAAGPLLIGASYAAAISRRR